MESARQPVALITGGGGGIGRATAFELATRGYRIAIADISESAADAVARELREGDYDAEAFVTDVGVSHEVRTLLAAVRARFGHLDMAFNNAGASALRLPLAEVADEDWERLLRTNLSGTFLCMKYQIQWMLESGGGCIVNNCSIFGLGGGASASYTATKHGIAGLTRSAAISYAARGIRINAVCPGLIDSGMGARFIERSTEGEVAAALALHPAARVGTPEEVAKAVAWLCSDEARYIHGHLLPVDGGYGAR
jgi:NAD(P)-dependent dehydrogenase (short-subunit alcohol dehydrogenase family)